MSTFDSFPTFIFEKLWQLEPKQKVVAVTQTEGMSHSCDVMGEGRYNVTKLRDSLEAEADLQLSGSWHSSRYIAAVTQA